MRIGMILDESFPPDPRVENEAQVLIGQGHEVFLFCVSYTDTGKPKEIYQSIHVCRQHMPKIVYKLSALAYTFPLYHLILGLRIIRFIKKYNIEHLHIHDLQAARAGFWANMKFRLPIFLDLHENRPEIMRYYKHLQHFPGHMLIKPARWQKMEKKYIQRSTKTIVVTEEAREYYLKHLAISEDKFVVVPNTVSSDFYENYSVSKHIIEKYAKTFMLLYIGDTGERRGIETLVLATNKLKYQIPEIRLCILGKSTHDSILKNKVEELEISNLVDFEGWKSPELFQSYILASKLCTCPIRRNIHHDTTYANKLFQYAALGKPLLVSNCTAQQNLIEKYKMGLVFKADDFTDCSQKILTIYRDTKQQKEFGDNAQQAIRNALNWEVVSKNLISAYQ